MDGSGATTGAGPRAATGLQTLQSLLDGRLPAPPVVVALGARLVDAVPGCAVLLAEPQPWQRDAAGMVPGGVLSAWADAALSYAVLSVLPAGAGHRSLEIGIRLLRPVTAGTASVRIVATVRQPDPATVTADAELRDDAGRLLATAGTTHLIVPGGVAG